MKLRHLTVLAVSLVSASALAQVAGTGIGESTQSLRELAEMHPKLDLGTLKIMAEEEACKAAHTDLIADLSQKCVRVLNEESTRYVALENERPETCSTSVTPSNHVKASQIGTAECRSNRADE